MRLVARSCASMRAILSFEVEFEDPVHVPLLAGRQSCRLCVLLHHTQRCQKTETGRAAAHTDNVIYLRRCMCGICPRPQLEGASTGCVYIWPPPREKCSWLGFHCKFFSLSILLKTLIDSRLNSSAGGAYFYGSPSKTTCTTHISFKCPK